MNEKETLLQAKQLIQSKDYEAARKLLRGMNHPTAKQWLLKLDKAPSARPTEKAKGLGYGIAAALAFVLLLIGGATGYSLGALQSTQTPVTVEIEITSTPPPYPNMREGELSLIETLIEACEIGARGTDYDSSNCPGLIGGIWEFQKGQAIRCLNDLADSRGRYDSIELMDCLRYED